MAEIGTHTPMCRRIGKKKIVMEFIFSNFIYVVDFISKVVYLSLEYCMLRASFLTI